MPTSTVTEDRIEKQVVLRAPRERVWRALVDTQEFGNWFGVALGPGSFTPGHLVQGQVTHPGYTHVTFAVTPDEVDPERRMAWRWHPNAVDPNVDYSAEPSTIVEFLLEDVAEGTLLRVIESGFSQLPADRRTQAYRGNEDGWSQQMQAIARHVAGRA